MRFFVLLLAISLAGICDFSPARADDLGDCLEGQARYQAYLPSLQQARLQCQARSDQIRNDPTLSEVDMEAQLQTPCPMKQTVCGYIRPEGGHAACESYIQNSGMASESDFFAANHANAALKAVYDECIAQ